MNHREQPARIHITGAGGCATSGLARILHAWGHAVTGSDRSDSVALEAMRAAGLAMASEHSAELIQPGIDQLIHSVAVPSDNPELQRARQLGIPTISYPHYLGRLLSERNGIAIAGTHGKTTTAAMVASILIAADRDPTVLIGGVLPSLAGNWRCGSGPEMVVEACEYRRSFLFLRPTFAVVTNLERDHPDVYPDDDSVHEAFRTFALGMQPGGALVVNGDDPQCLTMPPPPGGCTITFGRGEHNEWRADRVQLGPRPRFRVCWQGVPWGEVELGTPGGYSVMNALAAIALTAHLELAPAVVQSALSGFPGVDRRFQRLGCYRGVDVVEDYAHHPTEVDSVIHAAREAFPERRLWALFQPHQLGRLQAFGPGFVRALATADEVGLLPTYTVREEPASFPGDLEERLASGIASHQVPVHRFQSLLDGVTRMPDLLGDGDVCLVMGAGDVGQLASGLCRGLAGLLADAVSSPSPTAEVLSRVSAELAQAAVVPLVEEGAA